MAFQTPPVYHTSTILRSNMEEHRNRTFRYDYGRVGTPTSEAFETSVADLYGSEDSVALPSGLSAIATGVNAVVKAGDSVLFPDSLYGSGRRFAEYILPRNGVKTVFYDPMIDAEGLAQLITKETSLVYIETPGSLTFEMQDTKAIVDTAHAHGCLVACDNTWGTPLYFDAFGHGIDIAIEAGTKYINGHSDVSIGVVAASGEPAAMIRKYTRSMGLTVGPDDLYLALQGLRTIGLRLNNLRPMVIIWPAGLMNNLKCWKPAIPGLKAIRVMISGNVTSAVHAACSASILIRPSLLRLSTPWPTTSPFTVSVRHGAGMKA